MTKSKINSKSNGENGEVMHKGQMAQNHQKGAAGVSKKTTGTHRKDESHGASKNTTKKQSNSI